MARYILTFEIDDAFYKEFSEHGATHEALLEQLGLDVEDQLAEYDLKGLMTEMISSPNHKNLAILIQKEYREGGVVE